MQVAIVSAIALLAATTITIVHQRSQLKGNNQRLQREVTQNTAEIQRLETLLTPFRTIAVEKFRGTEAEVLNKLADHLISVDTALRAAQSQLRELKTNVSEMKPDFGLLDMTQTKEDNLWVTRMLFGSKDGHPFSRFAVSLAFDDTYDTAKAFVTGRGMVVPGELSILEGASNSRIFRFYGTRLLADNNLVVEFRSKDKIQIIEINLEPKRE